MTSRTPEHAVNPQFIQRWSPRAYSHEAISQTELMSLFEAARWAPSTSNTQPWRFVYALAGSGDFEAMCQTLAPTNRAWAQRASALIAVISATVAVAPGSNETKPLPVHAFDTGAAWMSLALQAHLMGWSTHAMGGVDRDALRRVLAVPETFAHRRAIGHCLQRTPGAPPVSRGHRQHDRFVGAVCEPPAITTALAPRFVNRPPTQPPWRLGS